MKKYLFALVCVIYAQVLFAQSQEQISEAKIGAVYKIAMLKTSSYKHVNFPKPNIIVKRGGIVNYQREQGQWVVISSVKEKNDGRLLVKLKRKDGKRFFGSHSHISAYFKKALAAGELLVN